MIFATQNTITTLSTVLAERGLVSGKIEGERFLAFRLTLNPNDSSADFRTIADVVREGVASVYARMQDGRRFGDEAKVLVFTAETDGAARLTSVQRFVARRKGLVPGDIVYDYDAAHLLHSFIARARCPIFYDSFDEPGLDDMIGRLVVQWPKPMMRALRRANEPGLVVIAR